MSELEQRAKEFAEKAHRSIDQRRKYTFEPYINHPAAVVELVRSVPHTEEMLAAAWLHDVVEDIPTITINHIDQLFGKKVADLVEELTDVSHLCDGNRKKRREIDRQHTAKASPQGKTIKLADLIDNTKSIVSNDPEFAKVYIAEKKLLLEVLTEGNQVLYEIATKQVYESGI